LLLKNAGFVGLNGLNTKDWQLNMLAIGGAYGVARRYEIIWREVWISGLIMKCKAEKIGGCP